MGISLAGYSMPIFWWGLLLIMFFSVYLGWTPVSGRIDLLYDIEPVTGFMLIDTLLSEEEGAFKDALMADPYFNALRLKFGYAITCHKAQGSEWNHVFVKCKSHQSQLTADYFRWLYTAITRTARICICLTRRMSSHGAASNDI